MIRLLLALLLCLHTAPAFAASSVTCAWDANTEPDLAGYRLWHATTPGGPYTLVVEVPAGTNIATHNNVPDGTHYYVATAFDTSANQSGYSNEVLALTPPPDTTPPANPTGARVVIVVTVP